MAGTDLVPFESYRLATMDQDDLLEVIEANIGDGQINEQTLDRVKMPSGGSITWNVPTLEGDEDTKEIEGVIVFSKLIRNYWIKSYDDSDGNEAPDCTSKDSKIGIPTSPMDFTPPAPSVAEGYACDGCALAQYGSAQNGGGQACQQRRLLFLLTKDDILPFVVSLSPTSLKAASDYMMRLTRGGVPYYTVMTKITLVKHTDPKPHARAIFTRVGNLSGEEAAALKAYRAKLLPAVQNMTVTDAS